MGLMALAIYLSMKNTFTMESPKSLKLVYIPFFTLISLIAISILLQFIPYYKTVIKVELPDSYVKWIFCGLNFLFAAFYEEVIYRFYAPKSLKYILIRFAPEKVSILVSEIITCALFSFAHLQNGLLAVLNAAFAYILLRLCIEKTGSIWITAFVHFLYNIAQLVLVTLVNL